jgi:voltage-gated potassium channel
MHIVKMPPELQSRANRYYDYVWSTRQGYDDTTILEDLPTTLKMDVSNFLKVIYIKSCPFFEFCDRALIKVRPLAALHFPHFFIQ